MTLEIAKKAIQMGFEHPSPIVRILFFGGEPLLEVDLLDQIADHVHLIAKKTYKNKKYRFGLTTNGTAFTDNCLKILKKHKVNVTVSLDGDRQAHNAERIYANGKGTFDDVVQGLKKAQKALGSLRTLSVVHPQNVTRLGSSFDFIVSLGIRRMAFNLNYDACWDKPALDNLCKGYEVLANRVIEYYRAGNDFTLQPFSSKIISRLKDGFSPSDKCDFGCAEIAVAPSGRLYPCDRLIGEDGPNQDDIVIGHVDTGLDLKKITAMKKPKDTPKEDCHGCAIIDRCMWWCGCVNRALTGQVDQVSDLLCQVEQWCVQEADRIGGTLFNEGNPNFLNRYYLAALSSKQRSQQPT